MRKIILLAALIFGLSSALYAQNGKRVFKELANVPNINLVYISEAAFDNGYSLSASKIPLRLENSQITGFEMAKAVFDGKEKKSILKMADKIISENDMELLSETRDDFDSKYTKIYYVPKSKEFAKEIFIISSSNSFGATAIYITGKLWLKSFLSGSGVKDLSYLMEKYKFKTTDFNIIHL